MSKWSSIMNSRAEAQTIYFQRKEINRLKNKIELQKQEINALRKHLEQLKEDLQEANDNADWWHNRFKAVQQEKDTYKEQLRITHKDLENYISRCEKINEILKESPDFNYSNDYIILKRRIKDIIQKRSDDKC